jgi:hypothetical protein
MKSTEIWRTTYDRIEWLRVHPRDGSKALGSSEFALACGLSKGWLSGLATRTKQLDPPATDVPISIDAARGVAAHTSASEEWIMTGEGHPFERYPERAEALARFRDLPEQVRSAVESMRFLSEDRPSVARWCLHIDAELAAYHRGELLGEPLTAPKDTPPENDR